ncbi:uncharacterized protein B4U79_09014, partial [Dinothrombium tinctorium]
ENNIENSDEETLAALENPDFYEGDILLDNEDRFAIQNDKNLWPQGIIPYTIDPELANVSFLIRSAMKHIEEKTCIRFKKRTSEEHFVRIYLGERLEESF